MLVLPQQCKASTEQSQRGFELGTVLLWGNSNNQTTTVPPVNVVPSALILVCHWSEDIYTQRCWNFKYIKYQLLWVFSLFKKKISYQRKTKQQCASLLKTIVHCTVNQKLPDVVTRGFSVSNVTMTSWALGEVKCASLPRLSGVSRNGKRMRELFMEGEGGKKLFYLLKKHYSSEIWDKTYYSNHCVPNITTHAAIFWALKVGLTSSQPSF